MNLNVLQMSNINTMKSGKEKANLSYFGKQYFDQHYFNSKDEKNSSQIFCSNQ